MFKYIYTHIYIHIHFVNITRGSLEGVLAKGSRRSAATQAAARIWSGSAASSTSVNVANIANNANDSKGKGQSPVGASGDNGHAAGSSLSHSSNVADDIDGSGLLATGLLGVAGKSSGSITAVGTLLHTTASDAKIEAAETYRYATSTTRSVGAAGAAASASSRPPKSVRKRAANLLDVVDDVRGSTKLARYDHEAVTDTAAAFTALTGSEPKQLLEPIISKLAARNNERLIYLSRQLMNPAEFDGAMRELSAWCADARAFDSITAASLHACMLSVRQYAEQAPTANDVGRCHSCLEGCMRFEGIMIPEMSNQFRLWCEEILTLRLHWELVASGGGSAAAAPKSPTAPCNASMQEGANFAANRVDKDDSAVDEMQFEESEGCSLIMIFHIEGEDLDTEELGAYMYIRAALDDRIFLVHSSDSNSVCTIKYDDQRVFAYTKTPEDALRTALKTQLIVNDINGRFEKLGKVSVSIGIEYGNLLLMPGDYFGDPVNVASKLGEDTAKGGDLFISDTVLQMLSTSEDCKATRQRGTRWMPRAGL